MKYYLRFLISATFPLFEIVTISATKLKMVKKVQNYYKYATKKARGDHNFFVSSLELLYFIVVPTFSIYISWYSPTFSMLHLLRNKGSIFIKKQSSLFVSFRVEFKVAQARLVRVLSRPELESSLLEPSFDRALTEHSSNSLRGTLAH